MIVVILTKEEEMSLFQDDIMWSYFKLEDSYLIYPHKHKYMSTKNAILS